MRTISILFVSLLSFSSSISLSYAADGHQEHHDDQKNDGEVPTADLTSTKHAKKNLRGETQSAKLHVKKGEEVETSHISNPTNEKKVEVMKAGEEAEAIKEGEVSQHRRMASCYNMAGFLDSDNWSCNDYKNSKHSGKDYCPYAAHYTRPRGYNAKQACCTCGGGCVDEGAYWADRVGNGCDWYISNWRCTFADSRKTGNGSAKDFCCMCGGGYWQGL